MAGGQCREAGVYSDRGRPSCWAACDTCTREAVSAVVSQRPSVGDAHGALMSGTVLSGGEFYE